MPQSPSLPTTQPGTYVVNLRFVEPAVGFEIPVATDFVKSNEDPLRRAGRGPAVQTQMQRLTPGRSSGWQVRAFFARR